MPLKYAVVLIHRQPSEPTTTLQALVNLKRPTIRLSPLAHSETAASESNLHLPHTAHHQQHGLEFEFDCDAPRCGITLHAIGVPAHLAADHPANSSVLDLHSDTHASATGPLDSNTSEDRLLLFEAIVDGGFARRLSLSDGAVLELARLEHAAHAHALQRVNAAQIPSSSGSPVGGASANSGDAAHSGERERARKRLTLFHRKRSGQGLRQQRQQQGQAVTAGPALAVVDAEARMHDTTPPPLLATMASTSTNPQDADRERKKNEEAGGVKVTIKLTALDADGRLLSVRNEQVTYLHVVRVGPAPTAQSTHTGEVSSGTVSASDDANTGNNNTSGSSATEGEKSEANGEDVEDTRPWVVKVVKREARIGAHAFHLHEIYGLAAHTGSSGDGAHTHPTAPLPAPAHSYPPTADASLAALGGVRGTTHDADADADDATAECLLCLSAPREVVLLPCRHLVACRECAVNMVEFGAGGTLVHSDPTPTDTAPAAAGTTGASATNASTNAESGATENTETGGNTTTPTPAPAPVVPTPPAPTTRRKRKAKGWFCPVCRQRE